MLWGRAVQEENPFLGAISPARQPPPTFRSWAVDAPELGTEPSYFSWPESLMRILCSPCSLISQASLHTQTWCGERVTSVPARRSSPPGMGPGVCFESSIVFQICIRCPASWASRGTVTPHIPGSLGRTEFWQVPGSVCSPTEPIGVGQLAAALEKKTVLTCFQD